MAKISNLDFKKDFFYFWKALYPKYREKMLKNLTSVSYDIRNEFALLFSLYFDDVKIYSQDRLHLILTFDNGIMASISYDGEVHFKNYDIKETNYIVSIFYNEDTDSLCCEFNVNDEVYIGIEELNNELNLDLPVELSDWDDEVLLILKMIS